MSKDKDYLQIFFDTGVNFPTKTIVLIGSVNKKMLDIVMCGLHSLDSTHGEITIKMYSSGGDTTVAKAIYDLIRGCKNRVRIIGYGEIASSASIILQAGDLRVLSKNADLMLHVGQEGVPSDHPRNVDRLIEKYRLDEKWMEDVYLEKIREKKKRFTRNQLKSKLDKDTWLTPTQALELGLIDEIGEIQ